MVMLTGLTREWMVKQREILTVMLTDLASLQTFVPFLSTNAKPKRY